jgi:hypothetical protein
MDFENFTGVRDLICLSGAFLGAALGCVLSAFRKNISQRLKNRLISLCFCFFSGLVAAFALALIYSNGAALSAGPLFIPALIIMAVFILAFRFPRAAAFPLILAGGIFVIWIAYSFLRFPPVRANDAPLASVHKEEGGFFSVRFGYNSGNSKTPDPDVLRLETEGPPLDFRLALMSFDKTVPLIGGERRGLIAEIRRGDKSLFTDPFINAPPLMAWYALFSAPPGPLVLSFQRLSAVINGGALAPGSVLFLSFNGETFTFRP